MTLTERVLKALEIMGFGMLGIFLVIGLLFVAVLIFNKVTNRKKKNIDPEPGDEV